MKKVNVMKRREKIHAHARSSCDFNRNTRADKVTKQSKPLKVSNCKLFGVLSGNVLILLTSGTSRTTRLRRERYLLSNEDCASKIAITRRRFTLGR